VIVYVDGRRLYDIVGDVENVVLEPVAAERAHRFAAESGERLGPFRFDRAQYEAELRHPSGPPT